MPIFVAPFDKYVNCFVVSRYKKCHHGHMNRTKKQRAGLTQAQAARLLGVDRTTIANIEGGRAGPTAGALRYLLASWPRLSAEDQAAVLAEVTTSEGGENSEDRGPE